MWKFLCLWAYAQFSRKETCDFHLILKREGDSKKSSLLGKGHWESQGNLVKYILVILWRDTGRNISHSLGLFLEENLEQIWAEILLFASVKSITEPDINWNIFQQFLLITEIIPHCFLSNSVAWVSSSLTTLLHYLALSLERRIKWCVCGEVLWIWPCHYFFPLNVLSIHGVW